MKRILILLLVSYTVLSCAQEKSNTATTTYIFIRHAEKDLSNPSNSNPALTNKGKERAIQWSKIIDSLTNSNVSLIYSTDYDRTLATAKPIAEKFNLKIQHYKPNKLYSKSFRDKSKGKTVVVVGHSNTTPIFINKIIGAEKYKDIADDEYGKLFEIIISKDDIKEKVYSFN
ncbi:histidine phosphatase family protein [Aquimarina sp. W85]|uniref:SixA phosphatase family protein n=1 Tax=Aquimarina rhodophyticola TaxID=3342246 RepID=UPI00367324E5